MANEQYGSTAGGADILHLANSFFLEFGITHGEDFIDNEDLGLEEGGDGEAEADGHAAGEALDGGVDVFFDASEVDDFIELAGNLFPGHAHNAAIHVDVFSGGHLWVEACADFQKTGDAASILNATSTWGGDVAEEL